MVSEGLINAVYMWVGMVCGGDVFTYHPHPHVNSIDQPLTHHDLLSPNIDTLFTISLQMSICSLTSTDKAHLITKNTPIL